MNEMMTLLPMLNNLMVVKVPGETLHKLLENGVSSYPEFQGKFPSVSQIRFAFDPSKPPGSRIEKEDITVKGEPLEYERVYSVTSKQYMVCGKDGYTDFEGCEVVVNEHDGPFMPTAVFNVLEQMQLAVEGEELDEICARVGNPDKELSPEIEVDGKLKRFIMINPKLDGRIKKLSG